jgi:excisionase family DNA binding protein
VSAPADEIRTRLSTALAPSVVAAIDELVTERVREELETRTSVPTLKKWLTLREAAELLGCSTDAVRMRARRGRLEHRRHGRSLYISAASIETLGGRL